MFPRKILKINLVKINSLYALDQFYNKCKEGGMSIYNYNIN